MIFKSTAFHYIIISLVILDALLVLFEFLLGVGVLGMKHDYNTFWTNIKYLRLSFVS